MPRARARRTAAVSLVLLSCLGAWSASAAALARLTNSALATMSGTPSGGPTVAASQNGSPSVLPPGQLDRSLNGAAVALRPMLPT